MWKLPKLCQISPQTFWTESVLVRAYFSRSRSQLKQYNISAAAILIIIRASWAPQPVAAEAVERSPHPGAELGTGKTAAIADVTGRALDAEVGADSGAEGLEEVHAI